MYLQLIKMRITAKILNRMEIKRDLLLQRLREFGIRKLLKKLVISLLFCNFIAVNQ